MKARPRPDWNDPNNKELRRRVLNDFVALREAERDEIQYYLLMGMCIAVHDTFGAGEKRLQRFLDSYENTIRRMDKTFDDDAEDLIYREIEALGMKVLVDDMRKAREKTELAMRGTFIDFED